VVQEEVATAIGKIGDPGAAVDAVLDALKDANPAVREEAAESLRRKGQAAVAPLIHALAHRRDIQIKREAAEALLIIGEPAVEPLIHITLRTKAESVRKIGVKTLGELADARAVEPLCQIVAKDQSAVVRHCAAVALGNIGDPDAAATLIQAMKDKDVRVRKAADKSLKKIKVERVTREGRTKEASDV
jgi:HEAT repeat protein